MIQASLIFLSSLIISWLPNVEQDLAGYRIYYGTLSGVYSDTLDVGVNTSYTIADLDSSQIYYFAVTAYDFSGNESSFSTEVNYAWTQIKVGDFNGDGRVNLIDRELLKAKEGLRVGNEGFNSEMDLNEDGEINLIDRELLKAREE
jgi:hypothetical protein